MLLLIASVSNNMESYIAKRFGHANYYILYDTETKDINALVNNREEHNHANLKIFLDKGVEAFIVGNIGPSAFKIINTSKSKVYLARKMTVQQAIDNFLRDELQQLFEPTVKKSIGHRK